MHIKIKWQPDREPETKITFTSHFHLLERIAQLDLLKDAIYDLGEYYNQMLGGDGRGKV